MQQRILVAIVLGSTSDFETLKTSGAFQALETCDVPYDVSVVSAHRNPEERESHCADMRRRGALAFVAGAGMAAHLPGAICAQFGGLVPVFGVPLDDDAVPAMQAMPGSRPVHVQSKGKAGFLNAVIGALQFVSLTDPHVAGQFGQYMHDSNKQPIYGKAAIEEALAKAKKKEA